MSDQCPCGDGFCIKNNDFIIGGGDKYICNPLSNYSDICEKTNEEYKKEFNTYPDKKTCMKYCESKYIGNKLSKSGLIKETTKFYNLIKHFITKEQLDVYVKGGNALGLKVLRLLYHTYKTKDEFEIHFKHFLKLELIKDWDFCCYLDKEITINDRNKFDKIAHKYRLVPKAKTFILYRDSNSIELEKDKPLFEIAIVKGENLSDMEIPLTTMRVQLNIFNIKYIFAFANEFYLYSKFNKPFDIDLIMNMIKRINVLIYPYHNGLYKTTKDSFDNGNLNSDLVKFINTFDDFDKYIPQFLITHIKEPNRLFYRFLLKNVDKNNKIKKFIKTEKIGHTENWLLDTTHITNILKIFLEKLSSNLSHIFTTSLNSIDIDTKSNIDKIKYSLDKVDIYLQNIYLNRLEIDFDKFDKHSLKLIYKLFEPIISSISESDVDTLYNELDINNKEHKNKIIYLIKFLIKKNIKKLF